MLEKHQKQLSPTYLRSRQPSKPWTWPLLLAVFVLLVLSVAVLFRAKPAAWLYYIPLCSGPICAVILLVFWALEAQSHGGRKTSLLPAFSFLLFGYIPVAIVFAGSYLAASRLGGQVVENGNCVTDFTDLIYFSIVTASTLGYGDLQPLDQARWVECIEVVTFWAFLGVGALHLRRVGEQ